jgi:hypothetical protein
LLTTLTHEKRGRLKIGLIIFQYLIFFSSYSKKMTITEKSRKQQQRHELKRQSGKQMTIY